MHILYVVENYYPNVGGVETVFQTLAESLAQQPGFKVTVVTSQLPNATKSETYQKVKIIRIWLPQFLRRYWFSILGIWPALQAARSADLIHTTTYNAALPAWLAGVLTGTPTIITVHEVLKEKWFKLEMPSFIAVLLYIYEWLLLHLPFALYIAVSDATKADLINTIGNKLNIKRIYNGIDYDFWDTKKYHFDKRIWEKLHIYDQRKKLLFFGRPGWVKGVNDLVSFWVRSPGIQEQFCLVLLLSQEPLLVYNQVKDLIKRHQLDSEIYIRDSVPRELLPKVIKSAAAVIIPSRSEGFGFSAVEASSLDVPVFARKVGSLPEVLMEGSLFTDFSELKEKLLQPHTLKYIHKKFPVEVMVENYKRVYTELKPLPQPQS